MDDGVGGGEYCLRSLHREEQRNTVPAGTNP